MVVIELMVQHKHLVLQMLEVIGELLLVVKLWLANLVERLLLIRIRGVGTQLEIMVLNL